MKKIILVVLVILCTSGCASSFQRAANDCQAAGFKPGTDMYLTCVNNQTKRTAFEQYMINRASNPPREYTTICQRSYVPGQITCTTY
jgi:uncharacterized protein YceK